MEKEGQIDTVDKIDIEMLPRREDRAFQRHAEEMLESENVMDEED